MKKKDECSILIVDDSKSMRKVLILILEEAGYKNVHEAIDGNSALAFIKTNPVDLILGDWIMPGISGLELLEKIRANPKTESLPFIMISSEARSVSISNAKKLRIDGYIAKPFLDQEVVEKVNCALGF